MSWHDPLYPSGNIAVEAIPGADYGFSNFGGGTPSTPVQSTITTTSIQSSTSSVNLGQPVIYTATVTPAPDGGTVAFADAGVPIPGCAAQTINSGGTATCAVTYTAPGSHVVTAVYSGSPDGAFAGSDNIPDATVGVIQPKPIVVAVTQPTKTRLTVSNATPAVRAAIRYSASVTPAPDGGTVSFRDHGAPIRGCSSMVVKNGVATCKLTYATTGTHQIAASYGGSTHFGASVTSTRRVTVSRRPTLSIAKHRFVVTAVCPAGSGGCRLTSNVTVTIRGVRKAISPKRLSARIKAGKTKRLTFVLNGAAYATLNSALHRHHGVPLRVRVRIVVRDGNGSGGTQVFTFTVERCAGALAAAMKSAMAEPRPQRIESTRAAHRSA